MVDPASLSSVASALGIALSEITELHPPALLNGVAVADPPTRPEPPIAPSIAAREDDLQQPILPLPEPDSELPADSAEPVVPEVPDSHSLSVEAVTSLEPPRADAPTNGERTSRPLIYREPGAEVPQLSALPSQSAPNRTPSRLNLLSAVICILLVLSSAILWREVLSVRKEAGKRSSDYQRVLTENLTLGALVELQASATPKEIVAALRQVQSVPTQMQSMVFRRMLPMVGSTRAEVSDAAIEVVGGLTGEAAIRDISSSLLSGSAQSGRLVEALAGLGWPSASEPLRVALSSPKSLVAAKAASIVGTHYSSHIPDLAKAAEPKLLSGLLDAAQLTPEATSAAQCVAAAGRVLRSPGASSALRLRALAAVLNAETTAITDDLQAIAKDGSRPAIERLLTYAAMLGGPKREAAEKALASAQSVDLLGRIGLALADGQSRKFALRLLSIHIQRASDSEYVGFTALESARFEAQPGFLLDVLARQQNPTRTADALVLLMSRDPSAARRVLARRRLAPEATARVLFASNSAGDIDRASQLCVGLLEAAAASRRNYGLEQALVSALRGQSRNVGLSSRLLKVARMPRASVQTRSCALEALVGGTHEKLGIAEAKRQAESRMLPTSVYYRLDRLRMLPGAAAASLPGSKIARSLIPPPAGRMAVYLASLPGASLSGNGDLEAAMKALEARDMKVPAGWLMEIARQIAPQAADHWSRELLFTGPSASGRLRNNLVAWWRIIGRHSQDEPRPL